MKSWLTNEGGSLQILYQQIKEGEGDQSRATFSVINPLGPWEGSCTGRGIGSEHLFFFNPI